MTEKELRKKNPNFFRKSEKDGLVNRKKRLKKLSKKQLAELHAGKVKLPEIPRTERVNFGANRIFVNCPYPTKKEKESRKWFIARLIRKRVGLHEIKKLFCEQYKCAAQTAQKYIRKTYEEFQDQYTPEKRCELMAEHLEFLKQAMQQALQSKNLMAAEKLGRQYAECIRILNPAGFNNLVVAQDNRQVLTVNDQRTAEITLNDLESMSTDDFINRLLGSEQIKKSIGQSNTGTAFSGTSRETALLPSCSSPHDYQGPET